MEVKRNRWMNLPGSDQCMIATCMRIVYNHGLPR